MTQTQSLVLITGAASGLGWALAQRYHQAGYGLLLVDIQENLLSEQASKLTGSGLVHTFVADITDASAIDSLYNEISLKYGALDILINNAGITHRSLIEKTQPEVFRKVMAVDYQGPVELTLAFLPMLKHTKGTIINVSSMAGWMPVLGRAGYCAAKSALHQFFEVMRCEIRQYGIHILMVYPSFLDTPIEKNALGHDGKPAAHKRSMIGGMGSAENVAQLIFKAHQAKQERLFPNKFTWFASVLYKIMPRAFLRQMTKKFKSELNT